MANNRSAIRSALKDLLVNAATSAGSNVYTSRETTLWKSELPAILIYTESEPVTPESIRAQRYIRTLQLRIEVKVEATADIDDEIDALVAEVETAIQTDPSFGGTVLSTTQTNTELQIDAHAEKEIGVGILSFECKYIS